MTTAAAKKIKAKRARRPIYGMLMRAAILETGEERVGWFASHPIDQRLCKERRYRVGHEYRLEIKQARVKWQHRLIHKIGQLMVDNVEGWEQMTSHDAVKRLQLESGVCCETVHIDAMPVISAVLDACEAMLGQGARKVLAGVLPELKTLPLKVAESLAYDDMEQDRFEQLFDGITEHIGRAYAQVMLDDVRAEFWEMAGVNGRAA